MNKSEKKALFIIQKLFSEGFIAYFAGGWVRDFLLGKSALEIDIATSAPPEKIVELFPKSIPLGIEYGVVIVVIDGTSFEVTTFRKDHPYKDGRHPEGVDFSTPEHDAERRDFTINGMFYDPLSKTLHDYVGGQNDLKAGIIRAIGDPIKRFEEDKLRMLRAVRFAYKLHFKIEEKTHKAIEKLSSTLFPSVSMERVWQEFNKMSPFPNFNDAILEMYKLGLLATIFPDLKNRDEKEIKKRVAPFPYFPINCPTIVYILELFSDFSYDQKTALCEYLKTTNEDIRLMTFFHESESLFAAKTPSPSSWAYFYAHRYAELFLECKKAKLSEKQVFSSWHQKNRDALSFHIKKIQEKKPLVTSSMLRELGIEPGKTMGLLLKEAEAIAINEDIRDPKLVLKKLQNSASWPK